ncbi:iron ABC transporter permease [Agrobacterium pusense]|uniref:iron ABC transporter permease n=1 Tax=Agrobacterium pusense TaxID=648995 RepID=UPI0028A86279|nr:iron ABC transporter permease [Agrobacterium pusense]
MTIAQPLAETRRGFWLTTVFALLAISLALLAIKGTVDPAILFYSTLPRIAAAVVSGFLLGLGGAVFQRTFDNPLAEPTVLGISGGAALGMAVTLVFAPVLWTPGYQIVALAGAGLVLLIALAVAWGPRLSSSTLLLAGIMLNLFCNAAYTALVLFNHDFLSNLLMWQAGSLQQSGWAPSLRLIVLAVLAIGPLCLLETPLRLLSLGHEAATNLGVSVRTVKLLLLVITSCLSASVIAEFGQIGLIGLAAPAIARATWGRAHPGLLQCALTGAWLLLLTDQVMRLLSTIAGDLPVGAAAGLLAGPVLILLARRTPASAPQVMQIPAARLAGDRRLLVLLAVALPVAAIIALFYGRGPEGWVFAGLDDVGFIWRWRLPPLLASAGAGMCLALAGLLLQRLLRNPLASPDLLGITHGAGLAVTLLGFRSMFEPSRMLLVGLGLANTANAMLVIALAGGGQRGAALLGWFAGMTAGVDMVSAVAACMIGLSCLAACLLMHRRIDLIALGDVTATGFGVPVRNSRALGMGVAAVAIAAGTLVVGPISFIGLMIPHIAAMIGFRSTATASIASALIGALTMVLAEWLSRNLVWPWPLSPSILAALVGGPWFLWYLRRQAKAA